MSHSTLQYIFDRRGVREVDRLAVDEFAMPSAVLMENAAQGVCAAALDLVANIRATNRLPRIAIVCGPGNNGGDGYAAARLLHNAQGDVVIYHVGVPREGTDAAINRTICERMNLPIEPLCTNTDLREADLIIDAVLGTGLDKPVHGPPAEAVAFINAAHRPVLAVDLPSGMDCDTGKPLGACVNATRTVTFVGRKKGFDSPDAQKLLGEVTVADIGVPIELVQRLAIATRSPAQTPARG